MARTERGEGPISINIKYITNLCMDKIYGRDNIYMPGLLEIPITMDCIMGKG